MGPRSVNSLLLLLGGIVCNRLTGTVGFTRPSLATRSNRNPSCKKYNEACCSLKKVPDYSREILLREEAEAPFRKVRFFFYASLGAGALVSLLVSATRVAAALSGINTDLLQESALNTGVDVLGLVVLTFLWRNDVQAQESRLKRASKGAELAKLKVRGSKSMMEGYISEDDQTDKTETFTTSLASLRRGRGIEKRVIIVVAGSNRIASILETTSQLGDDLVRNDLLVVPVELPRIAPPNVPVDELSACVALPVGPSWNVVISDEVEQAVGQGIDVDEEGFCVILKKNGKVGQRTRGVFLENMVREVKNRKEAGMDVKNI